jgi:hypothetical protein
MSVNLTKDQHDSFVDGWSGASEARSAIKLYIALEGGREGGREGGSYLHHKGRTWVLTTEPRSTMYVWTTVPLQ